MFIDEIQFVSEVRNHYVDDPEEKLNFIDVVLGLMKIPNVSIYVTGSNSKMLSSDILTQFRDRVDEIHVNPLSPLNYEGDKRSVWRNYYTYGGMPLVWMTESHEERSRYLRDLFTRTYLKDVLASCTGLLTNFRKLNNTFASKWHVKIAPDTIDAYIGYFMQSFLLQKESDMT